MEPTAAEAAQTTEIMRLQASKPRRAIMLAMIALFTAFGTHDYGIAYVASHSARSNVAVAQRGRACAPRTSLPGSGPQCSPSRHVTWPETIVAS